MPSIGTDPLSDGDFERIVSSGPTRSKEVSEIVEFLTQGRSVVVVCLPGDGASSTARQVAQRLGGPELSKLRVTSDTTAADVADFVSPNRLSGRPRVLSSGHLLPVDAETTIITALFGSPVPIAYFVDGDLLHRADRSESTPLAHIANAWGSGEIERVDLAPVTGAEALDIVTALTADANLDDLQLRTIAALSAGRPLLALDLAVWASWSGRRVPRRYPHASVDSSSFGNRTQARLSVQYPNLPLPTLETARRLATLSPLPLRTAVQLFGDTTVTHLVNLRLAREVDVTGQLSVAVSPVHLAALNDFLGGPPSADSDREFSARLYSMWHAGYPMGETAIFALARQVIRDGQIIDHGVAELLLNAAQAANRLGDTAEATVFLKHVEASIDDSPSLRLAWDVHSINRKLVSGETEGALTHVRSAIGRGPFRLKDDPMAASLLFVASTAVACAPETPGWWQDFMAAEIEPQLPGVTSVVSTYTGRSGADPEQALLVADSPLAPPSLQLASLSCLMQYSLNHDDIQGLIDYSTRGAQLIAAITSVRAKPLDDLTYTIVWFFGIGAALNMIIAGVDSHRFVRTLRSMQTIACGASAHSGWEMTSSMAWALAIERLLDGDHARSRANFEALVETITPAMLAVGWGGRRTVQRLLNGTFGLRQFTADVAHIGFDLSTSPSQTFHAGFSRLFLGPGSSDSESRPDWMRCLLVHARMLDGTLSPGDAARQIGDVPTTSLPAIRALRQHIIAHAEDDAQGLIDVGRKLHRRGYRAAAHHALEQARALFLARRQSSKAREAGEALDALERVRYASATQPNSDPPYPAINEATVRQVGELTERELEICRLVADGLTNVQISQHLVLSVRTVESHVLQARAKLGAKRRRDIPLQLLRQGDLARTQSVRSTSGSRGEAVVD